MNKHLLHQLYYFVQHNINLEKADLKRRIEPPVIKIHRVKFTTFVINERT